MNIDEKYMNMAIQLAKQGMGKVAPNPMVGCVIVSDGEIIGQGFHEKFGGPHAEVNAINNIVDQSLLKSSMLYVNLEPCSHQGKTPPCTDLIIKHQIPKVIIGCIDDNSEVSGKGIKKLQDAGIEVIVGILEKISRELNKSFFTYHNKKRPYIILKWAKTKDGFMDVDRNDEEVQKMIQHYNSHEEKAYNWITTDESKKLVHHWRTEVQSIMVGTNTVVNDNPQLTVREVEGENPIRLVLDLNLRLPKDLRVLDGSVPTLVYNYVKDEQLNNLEYIKLDPVEDLLHQILDDLYKREIQSVLVEGGAQLLNTFIYGNIWDEARVFTGLKEFNKGLEAPELKKEAITSLMFGEDHLEFYVND